MVQKTAGPGIIMDFHSKRVAGDDGHANEWGPAAKKPRMNSVEGRAVQLENIIADAQKELQSLRGDASNPFTTSCPLIVSEGSISSPPMSPPSSRPRPMSDLDLWRPAELRRPDCVATAVSYGLVTRGEIEYFYTRFVTEISPFLPFGIDTHESVAEMERSQPLLTLAMVVACAASVGPDPMEHLVSFIDRVISERLFILGAPSLEIVRTLVVLCVFCQPNPGTKFSVYMLMGISCTIGLGLGSSDDVKMLMNCKQISADVARITRQRIQTFLSVYFSVAPVAVGTNKLRLLQMLSDTYHCCDILLSTGDDVDRLAAYTLRLLSVGIEGLRALSGNRGDLSPPAVKLCLESYKDRLNAISSSLHMLDPQDQECSKIKNISFTFMSFHTQLLMEFNEGALNQLVFCTTTPQSDMLSSILGEVSSAAQKIIDKFIEACPSAVLFPKYMYFRPLHALMALVRARLIMWALNGSMDLQIEERYERVKHACISKSNTYTGKHMLNLLQRVERWMALKLKPSTNGDSTNIEPTPNELLRRVIKSLLMAVRTGHTGSEHGVRHAFADEYFIRNFSPECPASYTPPSAVPMSDIFFVDSNEQPETTPQDHLYLLKEIFGESIVR